MKTVVRSTNSKRPRLSPAAYTLVEVAGLLGHSYSATHESALRGDLPVRGFKVGRAWRFPKADVDRLLGLDAPTVSDPLDK